MEEPKEVTEARKTINSHHKKQCEIICEEYCDSYKDGIKYMGVRVDESWSKKALLGIVFKAMNDLKDSRDRRHEDYSFRQ